MACEDCERMASRFEEVQKERDRFDDEAEQQGVLRAEADKRAEELRTDLERAEAEMTLSEDEALALFAWFDHVGVPYVPAMSAFRRDLDVVEAKIRAFLALVEARERGEQ